MAISTYLGMTLTPRQWPEKGDRMVFLGKSAWKSIAERAEKAGFVVGQTYTVVESYIGRSDHEIAFEEIPGKFNGSLFEHEPGPRADEVAALNPWRFKFS